VLAHTEKAKNVADLFCGVGPFALRLAERARVSAFDQDAAAIAALTQAARAATGLKPIETTARDLFRRPLVAQELKRFDAVVFDPPRQGAQAQARELASSAVPLVVAVSCNPATFARDARILADGGYRLAAVTPVDQFRYSAHVEIVARFER
jgi:23S rRNA (uracil1939-C5)-methyltransferase